MGLLLWVLLHFLKENFLKNWENNLVLSEIYENENGLHHHFIESKDFVSEFDSMITTYNLEYMGLNQMKIIQSLLGLIGYGESPTSFTLLMRLLWR